MDSDIHVTLVGVILNMILSLIVPELLKYLEKNKIKELNELERFYNGENIVSKSLLVGVLVFMSLKAFKMLESILMSSRNCNNDEMMNNNLLKLRLLSTI